MKIFTCNDINPEFVELQLTSFKKYMQEDFEFILFNGEALSTRPKKAKEISRICRSLSIPVIEVQRDPGIEEARSNNPYMEHDYLFRKNGRYTKGVGGYAHNYALQWAWEKVISKEKGPVCYVHSDIFLIEPIRLTDYLQEHSLCFAPSYMPNALHPENGNLLHIWEPLVLADVSKLPSPETINWWPSFVEGTWIDTGGRTHYYLKAHPEIKCYHIDAESIYDDPTADFHPPRYQFFHLGDKKIFHYWSGSRWFTNMPGYANFSIEDALEYHEKKLAWTRKLIGVPEIVEFKTPEVRAEELKSEETEMAELAAAEEEAALPKPIPLGSAKWAHRRNSSIRGS